jgi:hypothetical protein
VRLRIEMVAKIQVLLSQSVYTGYSVTLTSISGTSNGTVQPTGCTALNYHGIQVKRNHIQLGKSKSLLLYPLKDVQEPHSGIVMRHSNR